MKFSKKTPYHFSRTLAAIYGEAFSKHTVSFHVKSLSEFCFAWFSVTGSTSVITSVRDDNICKITWVWSDLPK